ncbi:Alpha amylase family protein [Heterostelium album PN500]|uniref:Alpha amylase family protein n=1 Tax=Heterostelium pallidum (strain ATCC 26659 / Pp 5 / PN500) TaxID=670386 RepID=D3BE64_HETP5|nr:Alpha amylase family protein [Heterostelium album PN500]EFA80195.1 Alpha amylase family protein [Heterostelium album PN500]|eukprot:XP_020432315.1 Alpha amylase family protein [Heterostelium album PN500]
MSASASSLSMSTNTIPPPALNESSSELYLSSSQAFYVDTTSPLNFSQEELLDYSEHEHSEQSILNNLWYKEAIFYEVYVRAFCDVEGTGNGGISGITAKLDYLHSLGVDCIWLLPIYPSPLKDDGYDVSDYCDIHPDYGTLNDFKILVKAVHERNMKIIADFIPNHCSEQHRWFQEARKDRNSPYRDYFVWTDDPQLYKEARIIFLDVEPSNWTYDEVAGQYYWHRFYKEQPDLNFDNPKVQQEMLDIMKFWLDLGIDGFRVDAVPYLFERDGTSCENLPETHIFLKKMRHFIDENYPGRIILAEACQMPKEVRKYFGEGEGDEFHMGFHFPVMPRIYMAIKRGDGQCLKDIMEQTPDIPTTCQWVTFLRNHDELTLEMVTPDERKEMWAHYAPVPRMKINMGIRRRLAPLMDNDQRKIELAYSLLFTLPGSPIIYYGDEIGMGDNIWLEDRHGRDEMITGRSEQQLLQVPENSVQNRRQQKTNRLMVTQQSSLESDRQSHYLVDILTDHQCIVDTGGRVNVSLDPYCFYWFSMGEITTLIGEGPKSRDLRRRSIYAQIDPSSPTPTPHSSRHLSTTTGTTTILEENFENQQSPISEQRFQKKNKINK